MSAARSVRGADFTDRFLGIAEALGHERAEVAPPVVSQHNCFAVDQRPVRRQTARPKVSRRGGERRFALRLESTVKANKYRQFSASNLAERGGDS
jgi:hypothetical protein